MPRKGTVSGEARGFVAIERRSIANELSECTPVTPGRPPPSLLLLILPFPLTDAITTAGTLTWQRPDLPPPSASTFVDEFSIRIGGAMEGNRFSFSAECTALGINSRLTSAPLRGTFHYDRGGGKEERDTRGRVAVSLPRHSIYRKDGDIMQSMGMPRYAHAYTAHKEPSRGDVGGRGEEGELVHAPSVTCATWAVANSRPVYVLLRARY